MPSSTTLINPSQGTAVYDYQSSDAYLTVPFPSYRIHSPYNDPVGLHLLRHRALSTIFYCLL